MADFPSTAQIDAWFADNTVGDISAIDMRTYAHAMRNAAQENRDHLARWFATRAALVTYIAANPVSVAGEIYMTATAVWQSVVGSTLIADLPGLEPVRYLAYEHFNAVGTSGTVYLDVPSDFATIAAAYTWLLDYRIATGTICQVRVAAGTHAFPGLVNHPDGASIHYVGDPTVANDPSSVIISQPLTDNSAGFKVDGGHTIGLIDMMTLQRDTVIVFPVDPGEIPGDPEIRGHNNAGLCIVADDDSLINVGPYIDILDWYYAIAARRGSTINVDHDAGNGNRAPTVTRGGDVGVWAYTGGTIRGRYIVVRDCWAWPLILTNGSGFTAEAGGTLDIQNCEAHDNALAGFNGTGGAGRFWDSSASGNGFTTHSEGGNFMVRQNGIINFRDSRSWNVPADAFDLFRDDEGTGQQTGFDSMLDEFSAAKTGTCNTLVNNFEEGGTEAGNGRWAKYIDGTLEIVKNNLSLTPQDVGNGDEGMGATWTFPAEAQFVNGATIVTAASLPPQTGTTNYTSCNANDFGAYEQATATTSTVMVKFIKTSAASLTGAQIDNVRVKAVGRWK